MDLWVLQEHELKVSYNSSNEALKSSQEEVITLQKSLDAAKVRSIFGLLPFIKFCPLSHLIFLFVPSD